MFTNNIVPVVSVLLVCCLYIAQVDGCSSDTECPHDQCCGSVIPDVLGLFKTCQVYSKLGEGCHGSLLSHSCDCLPGLVCEEYTGITSVLHTSHGVCRQIDNTDPLIIG